MCSSLALCATACITTGEIMTGLHAGTTAVTGGTVGGSAGHLPGQRPRSHSPGTADSIVTMMLL
jgi:hypothetical protein